MQYIKQNIKARIVDAARNEFLRCGFVGGGVCAISAASGIAIGNLYRYFESKLEILSAIVGVPYRETQRMLDELFNSSDFVLGRDYVRLADRFNEIFDCFGIDLAVLYNKCKGTPYADFSQKLADKILAVEIQSFYEKGATGDKKLFAAVAESFVKAIFETGIALSGSKRKSAIERVCAFYFYGADERFGLCAESKKAESDDNE